VRARGSGITLQYQPATLCATAQDVAGERGVSNPPVRGPSSESDSVSGTSCIGQRGGSTMVGPWCARFASFDPRSPTGSRASFPPRFGMSARGWGGAGDRTGRRLLGTCGGCFSSPCQPGLQVPALSSQVSAGSSPAMVELLSPIAAPTLVLISCFSFEP